MMLAQLLVLFSALSCALGHGPHVHPLSQWASSIHLLREEPQLPAVQLKTNCSSLSSFPAYCNVSWAGVLFPTDTDILALYVPANVDPSTAVPIKFAKASDSAHYLTEGSGWASFHIINMRQSMGFKFIKNGFVKPVVIGSSAVIHNLVPLQPSQGHLAVHEDSRHIVVQWVSGSSEVQQVQYGVSPPLQSASAAAAASLSASVASKSRTYTKEDMCGFPASSVGWLDPGYIHTATFVLEEDVQANQVVKYRYGSEAAGWSEERSFRVSPRAGVRSDPPLKFLVFNDVAMSNSMLFNDHCPPWCPGGLKFNTNYGINSTKLPRFLELEEDAHVSLLMGDLSYAIGFAADWDYFGAQFERSFTQWPLAVAMGNHERDWPNTSDAFQDAAQDSGGECGVPTVQRYSTPNLDLDLDLDLAGGRVGPRASVPASASPPVPAGAGALFYSFSRGSVHFLVLDTEMPSDPGSEQGRFVASDLSAVDRSVTPWVVVGLHRMMWAPATWRSPPVGDMDNMERLQGDLEELFMEYEVDVVVQGHEHAYARSCPLYKGACVGGPKGEATSSRGGSQRPWTNSAVARSLLRTPSQGSALEAGAGAGAAAGVGRAPVYVLAGHAGAGFTHGFPKVLPPWVLAAYQNRNGYLRFQASFSSLIMEAVSSDDGSIMDQMELTREES